MIKFSINANTESMVKTVFWTPLLLILIISIISLNSIILIGIESSVSPIIISVISKREMNLKDHFYSFSTL